MIYLLISIACLGSILYLSLSGLAVYTGIDMMCATESGVAIRWVVGPLNILMGILGLLIYAALFTAIHLQP